MVKVGVGVLVGVGLEVLVGVLVGVGLGVLVGVLVGVAVSECVGVAEGVLVGALVDLLTGVKVGVAVKMRVGVYVRVLGGVSVGNVVEVFGALLKTGNVAVGSSSAAPWAASQARCAVSGKAICHNLVFSVRARSWSPSFRRPTIGESVAALARTRRASI